MWKLGFGDVRVAQSAAGKYREAGPNPESQFGDRFAIEQVGRQLIAHWTTQPEDWLAELLKRFEQEQMQFRAVLPVLRLGSLMERMNIDLASVKAGQDTINNMTFKDQVQMGNLNTTVRGAPCRHVKANLKIRRIFLGHFSAGATNQL